MEPQLKVGDVIFLSEKYAIKIVAVFTSKGNSMAVVEDAQGFNSIKFMDELLSLPQTADAFRLQAIRRQRLELESHIQKCQAQLETIDGTLSSLKD